VGITVRVLSAFGDSCIDLQRVAQAMQEMKDRTTGDLEALINQLANFVEDLHVQRNFDIGLPLVARSTSSSVAGSRPGWVSSNDLSPPPTARNRVEGSMPAITSPSALITVLRLIPDATATAVLPPRPSISDIAPATIRRWSSLE